MKYAILDDVGIITTVFEMYHEVALADLQPNTVQLSEGINITDIELLNAYRYVNGKLVFVGGKPSAVHDFDLDTTTWKVNINKLREEKAKQIDVICKSSILSGFNSSALGVPRNYPTSQTAQLNLTASVVDSYNPDNASDWTTSFWCANDKGDWAFTPHTTKQIRQVGSEAKEFISQAIFKNAKLQAQIQAATTQAALDLIIW